MKHRTALLWLIGLLVLAGLACAQSGEILTPEEATRRAEEARSSAGSGGDSGVESDDFAIGDKAILLGRSFLVNLFDAPGGKISAGQERGATVTVVAIDLDADGDLWYQIEAPTGTGWVPADSLEPIAVEDGATADGEDTGEGDSGEAPVAGALEPGTEAYLTARGFLVNLFEGPGSNRIIAGQERGAMVTILTAETVDGTIWYEVVAPTGQGWLPEENVTTEAP